MRQFWRRWLAANGVEAEHPGLRDEADLLHELSAMSAMVNEVEVVRFQDTFTLREELERFESRIYSDTWDISETIFSVSVKELRAWTIHEYGDLDQEIKDEVRFVIYEAQFQN